MMSPPVKLGSFCLGTLLVLSGCNFPLLNAASDGDTPKVLALLGQGVDANASLPVIGTHPLTLAAAGGHAETVCVLLDRGAQVTATDITGWTALHAAAYKGHSEIVRLLVERGAPTAPTNWVLSEPLVWAEKGGHTEVVAVLKEAEANALATKSLKKVGGEGVTVERHPSPCSQPTQPPRISGTP